ncbi:oligopeptide transporter protein, partial [Aureobasidium melanogenum]
MAQPAALSLEGDPRMSASGPGIAQLSTPALRNLHDPSVTIEEYFYYAKITREEQRSIPTVKTPARKLLRFGKHDAVSSTVTGSDAIKLETSENPQSTATDEKTGEPEAPALARPVVVTEDEWLQASRAARTATWGSVFYLITTDILGPYSVPWALAQMGYGPGIVLYTIFGALAGYTGWQIWQMFLKLDSDHYPMKTFGDVAFRAYGRVARHLVNILQVIQLIFNVGVIIIQNGQGLYQINSNICYIVCCVIWTVCGFVIGQVRTLQKYGWIANFAVWLNVIVMILTMAVVTHSHPNYEAAAKSNGADIGPPAPPVMTTAGPPADVEFSGQLVGLMQAVYSYGGAMLYCEFMSEMRKPFDFWKALIVAETFIYVVYLFFGIYVYSFQGQYTINPAQQGMFPHAALTAGNILAFLTALIAAGLYGNIGIKVMYQNIFQELLGLPQLSTRAGKLLWIGIVPIYWGVAFILAAAIPQFSALSGLVAALCILQFTYTFPPLLMLGVQVQYDAIRPDQGEGFNPATGETVRHDHGMKRWIRGFFARRWYIKLWNLIFFLGAFVTCVLGTYSSIKSMIDAYASGSSTAFSCVGPV